MVQQLYSLIALMKPSKHNNTKERKMSLIDKLQEEYNDYVRVNGLPNVSADEQAFANLERPQRQWIFKFIDLWDIAMEMEKLR